MGVVMRSGVVDTSNATVATCGVAIMAKGSVPGHSKTRLVPPLTFEQAAQCNTAFLRDVADNILAAAAERSIAGYIAYGPAEALPFFQDNLPRDVGRVRRMAKVRPFGVSSLLARDSARISRRTPRL